jgi:hypothetical protein
MRQWDLNIRNGKRNPIAIKVGPSLEFAGIVSKENIEIKVLYNRLGFLKISIYNQSILLPRCEPLRYLKSIKTVNNRIHIV